MVRMCTNSGVEKSPDWKGMLNQLHVRANLGDSERIHTVALELDSAAIRGRFEMMSGRVLVDAHRHSPALLKIRKSSICLRGV
jgi:hypothetical protein